MRKSVGLACTRLFTYNPDVFERFDDMIVRHPQRFRAKKGLQVVFKISKSYCHSKTNPFIMSTSHRFIDFDSTDGSSPVCNLVETMLSVAALVQSASHATERLTKSRVQRGVPQAVIAALRNMRATTRSRVNISKKALFRFIQTNHPQLFSMFGVCGDDQRFPTFLRALGLGRKMVRGKSPALPQPMFTAPIPESVHLGTTSMSRDSDGTITARCKSSTSSLVAATSVAAILMEKNLMEDLYASIIHEHGSYGILISPHDDTDPIEAPAMTEARANLSASATVSWMNFEEVRDAVDHVKFFGYVVDTAMRCQYTRDAVWNAFRLAL